MTATKPIDTTDSLIAAAPARLSEAEARALTARISSHLEQAWDLIVAAYLGRAWDALDYPNWDAYCESEFAGLRLRPPREERRERIASMRDAGLSTRAIAAATGMSKSQVARDSGVPDGTPADAARSTVGLDGKTYAAVPKPREPEPPPPPAAPQPRRQKPMPERAIAAGLSARRAAARMARLVADDAFTAVRDQLDPAVRENLLRARDAIDDALRVIDL